MALWNVSDTKPKYLSKEDRKSVVADKNGWSKKNSYTGVGGVKRTKTENLVAIGGLSSSTSMGVPKVLEVYVSNTSGGSTLTANTVNNVNVVYSEAITIGTTPTAMTLNVATGNTNVLATSSTDKTKIINADNTIVFTFTPTIAGEYTVPAQTITSANSKVVSVEGSEIATHVISTKVSDGVGSFTVD